MAERYFSVRHLRWAIASLAFALAGCSTSSGRQVPVDDVSIGGRAPQTVAGPRAGQPGAPASLPPAGASISSEELSSDDLMSGNLDDLESDGVTQPQDSVARRNLALASQSPVITNLMRSADTAYTERRWEDAASVLERALRIEPGNGLLWQRLAEVRFAQGDYLQTVQLASKSDALAGTNKALRTDNLILMIEAYEAMGDLDRADALRQNASDRVNRTSR